MKKTSTVKKAKSGTSLGMKSVKAGYDKNPGVTRADIISAAKNKAKNGAKVASKKVVAKKPIKKAQDGTKMLVDGKEYESGAMLPEVTVTASRITDDAGKKKSGKGGRGGRGLRDILEGNKIGRQMAKSYYGRGPLANRGPGTNRPGGNQLRQGRRRSRMYQDGGQAPLMEGTTLPEFTKTASRITDKPSKPKRTKDWTRKVYRVNKQAIKASGAGAKKVTNIFGMRKRYEEGGEVKKMKSGGKCKYGC
jgi:ribosomal protein L18E